MKTDLRTSRRAFVMQGATSLGAGVATVAGAAGPAPGAEPAGHSDREAIRQVHAAFIAGVEMQSCPAALSTHHAYRANAQQVNDVISLNADGQRASAAWHVDVKVGAPIEGDSTAAQMARQQGMLASVHWQSGVLHADYEKRSGQWHMTSLRHQGA